MQYKGMLSH